MAEHFDATLLSRIEDASLNASAPPQQRWIDGWLVRFSPGKARRARSINAVASGRLSIDDKLVLAAEVYREAGLPMHARITPFSAPPSLDAHLDAAGWTAIEETRVMICAELALLAARLARPDPPGLRWTALDSAGYAEAVGALRGSSAAERAAHAERLRFSPTPYRGYALVDAESGATVACGQVAREGGFAGLYDVFTAPARRGEGLASLLCERLLSSCAVDGAQVGYLQVSTDNEAARRVYRRLGFADGYSYHYRVPAGAI